MIATEQSQLLEAVKSVHRILEPLSPTSRIRVLKAVTALLEVPNLSDGGSGKVADVTNFPKQTKIDEFLQAKRPQNLYQRLACLPYYLECHDGLPDMTSKDSTRANSSARQQEIREPGRALSEASLRYGYFAQSEKHKKHLTLRGKAVVESLPDQSSVNRTHKEYPFSGKAGKNTKRKRTK